MPVERYVPQPQPQEPFYNSYQSTYERYPKPSFVGSDPYMRRDLTYHYRLPIQFGQNQYQKIRYSHLGTPSRAKCCQFETTGARSSPGSSSSTSSVASGGHASSLQDVQCQNYQVHYQQEKSTQCPINASRTLVPCRHGGCDGAVEYVGASGGRRICATPPPRPQERCEGCIQAAAQAAALAVAAQINAQQKNGNRTQQQTQLWRSTTPINQAPTLQPNEQPSTVQLTPRHMQTNRSLTPTSNVRSLTPTVGLSSSGTEQSGLSSSLDERHEDTPPRIRHSSASSSQTIFNNTPQSATNLPSIGQVQHVTPTLAGNRGVAAVQRAVSMPATPAAEPSSSRTPARSEEKAAKRVNYSQSERAPNRPPLNRSVSRREMIKNYIRKETANFFGVDEENEDEEQKRWLDRRKRMASRTMGPLKEEYATLSYRPQSQTASPLHLRHRRTASEAVPQSINSGQLIAGGRPDVLPGDVADGIDRMGSGLRRKDSTLTRHRPRPRSQQSTWSRSFPPDVPRTSPQERLSSAPEEEAEAFFTKSRPTSFEGDTVDRSERVRVIEPAYRTDRDVRYSAATVAAPVGWRGDLDGVVLRHPEQRAVIGSSRIATNTLDSILDNSDRRQYGMGWVGRLFGRSYRKSVVADARIQAQLDDMDDHRPYFTYWVTTVQVLVLLISIVCYGFGPFGVDLQAKSSQVLVTSLSLQQVDYMEPANFWGGPRAADLIHLGAKFAPCMRLDDKITQQIEKTRKKEKETACCIRNDDSGCVQSSQADCSKTISTWKKWTSGDAGPGGRISGSVCGLDPKYCDAPASVHPYEWPDDITKWPICRKTNNQISNAAANRRDKSAPRDKLAEHMVCEVSCLNDVCGMMPFYFPDVPDQFYRLWTSLFLHAGVLQLIITIMVQHFLMRDLEKLTGSLRIGIIYIGSGVGGNLASAIFVPYRADVGPAGSQFGLLACLIVEVLNSWPMLKHPNQALCKLLSITMLLFLIGLLPWVDNYAHLFGFVFGFLLSYALLPFVSFGHYDRNKKVFLIWVCLLTSLILFVVLVLLFYIIPVYDCEICSYFNCLPLTRDFCASQNINFKREEPIV
ncbi:unnamed protein product [Ceutorhynchus assimilis]|uniref:Peptidase S54 rhomboid domain-containing protein n=1 Tax=Ceutorhynchus assimilis TaxID=467358 RepID=A0A9N9MRL0_9CUCU|nr:unnamed protein product [Ceutorhynchus assimilis]